MKIGFSQIYPEVNTSFDLSHMLLRRLSSQLNRKRLRIGKFDAKYGGAAWKMILIISASRKRKQLQVMGPCYLRKRPEIEFALHIPYKEFGEFAKMAQYVLSNIEMGIYSIFEKYEQSRPAISSVIERVALEVAADPDKYQYVRGDDV